MNDDFHVYKIADFYKINPAEVYEWEDHMIENAVNYIALKEYYQNKSK